MDDAVPDAPTSRRLARALTALRRHRVIRRSTPRIAACLSGERRLNRVVPGRKTSNSQRGGHPGAKRAHPREPAHRTRSRGGRQWPTASSATSAARSTATSRSRRAMPGSTGCGPHASSGPRWPRSRHTTFGSPSFRSGSTPIAPATWTSRAAWVAGELLLTEDVNTIRATNNAIFDDIFWVHLAYVTADDGIERLRGSPASGPHYATILAGFEAIDQGRRVLEDATASAEARRRPTISSGRATSSSSSTSSVPWCNPTSIACRARSPGSSRSARPQFEVRGLRQETAYFTSFYVYSLTRGHSARCASARVAEDHLLRRPLAVARDERRSPLPEVRCRHALGRRQPATHPSTKPVTTRPCPASSRLRGRRRALSRERRRRLTACHELTVGQCSLGK